MNLDGEALGHSGNPRERTMVDMDGRTIAYPLSNLGHHLLSDSC